MITITIDEIELFDSSSESFIELPGNTFRFEHSLKAISEWESIWKIPFLNNPNLNNKQLMNYYKCMCLDSDFTNDYLIPSVVENLSEYMANVPTATTFQNENKGQSVHKIITSEVLYGMMVSGQVPFECSEWNINRLLVLLQVISDAQSPDKKMSNQEIMEQNYTLNEERKAKLKTKG